MIQINLLPKEYRKKNKFLSFKKGTAYVLAAAGLVAVLMVFATVYQSWKIKTLDGKIAAAKERTERLKRDIQLVDALSEVRQKLIRRMTAIENLDKYRTVWIGIMEDLSGRIPSYLWLSSFKERPSSPATGTSPTNATGAVAGAENATSAPDTAKPAVLNYGPRKTVLEGYCYSINSLAAFLINLSRSDYFKNTELRYIKTAQQENRKYFTFQLEGDLIYHIEPPSFAQAEQKGSIPNSSQPTQIDEPSIESSQSEKGSPEQSWLEEKEPLPVLAEQDPLVTESQDIIP
jgi:Tfp pilus assembly protein PilN